MSNDCAAFLRRWRGTTYDKTERNCWWLAALAQAELFGRTLPAADPALVADIRARAESMATHPARAEWREIETPVDGALVLMGKVSGAETHCGVFLAQDGGLILHTDERHGVVLDPPLELAAARRWRLTYLIPA
ncbi:NLP/P60 protein [Methylorubrum extorquens]|uniref:NLP/P60 protein n=1 Tax=Methylorubrum extorquens TaxID=408 RepID=A0A2N9AHJ7_METEX|nr:NLP/P60 protein [Methylorubrum extorquens]